MPWRPPLRGTRSQVALGEPFSCCFTLFISECGVVLLWTSCAITRCREIMTPQLSIVKTRFAKASLRPRCARHRSWHSTCRLPNRRAGTLSFPMVALDTQLPYGCVGHSATQFTRRIVRQKYYRWRIRPNMVYLVLCSGIFQRLCSTGYRWMPAYGSVTVEVGPASSLPKGVVRCPLVSCPGLVTLLQPVRLVQRDVRPRKRMQVQ